jgi:signal transduction histidine kinase
MGSSILPPRDFCGLELQIRDNGRGISGAELLSQSSLGMINMQNRAKKIGANLDVRTQVGRGAAIIVRLPINA